MILKVCMIADCGMALDIPETFSSLMVRTEDYNFVICLLVGFCVCKEGRLSYG